MKKRYQKPETSVVLMQVNKLLMASGDVQGNVRQYWTEDAEDDEYGL